MITIEKSEFEKLTKITGSDCWNKGHLVRQALLACPSMERLEIDYLGTGMWCDSRIYYRVTGHGLRSMPYRIHG